ncbi:NAD(P)/FAD-dependent oxidoreductase [Paenibacillus nicotianae]|uniref:NAD(P)/FAD-dependent oxidoreductase n=1 Tax=Paenibacillus nicotianae TaxID=1526551 RepID=A0ABW4UTN1_9BACL
MEQLVDVIIIGGGPAGLNAALILGRSRKNVLVIDEELPRNRVTKESHGFLTRDGVTPAQFRQIAREQISVYPSVQFVKDTVISASGSDGNFEIVTAQGQTYTGKKILFAVGMKDRPLTISGLQEVYGKSAFVCPYCDGWELRDQTLALIVNSTTALHLAKTISGWSDQFTIFMQGAEELTIEEQAELAQHQIPIIYSPIQHIHSVEGMVQKIECEDGTLIACTGIFFTPELIAGSDVPRMLGCESADTGMMIVDEFGKTIIPGVYSAGDSASRKYQVVAAASLGSMAGVSINSELLEEAWQSKANLSLK